MKNQLYGKFKHEDAMKALTDVLKEPDTPNKKIYFVTDCLTIPLLVDGFYKYHQLHSYVDTCKAIFKGEKVIVTTSLVNLSFDLIDSGYQIFIIKNGKIVEVKPGMDNPVGKDIRRAHNILKLFTGHVFDSMFD